MPCDDACGGSRRALRSLRSWASSSTSQSTQLSFSSARRPALVFLALWAVASGLLAFFPDDPVGTRTHGLARVHLALAFVAFVAVVVGTRLGSRKLRRESARQPIAPALTVISWAALVPIVLLARAKLRPHSLGGLWEKVFLAIELLWLAVAAVWLARTVVEAPPESTSSS